MRSILGLIVTFFALGLPTLSPGEEPAAPTETATSENETQAAESPRPVVRDSPTMDYLELNTTSVIGNQELPKVLYIVPWKKADLGDLVGKPVNSLLDEVLAPVDRDVFQRHLSYYKQLNTASEATD